MKRLFLLVAFLVLFVACSEYPEMDEDILAYHVFSEGQIDLGNGEDEYVNMVAKSFGMEPKAVRKIQKFILSKKTESNLHYGFESAMHAQVVELLGENSARARKKFVVDVLAPYLNALSKNNPYKSGIDREVFENDMCALFGKFFGESPQNNSLRAFIDNIHRYNNGGVSSTDNINRLNETLLKHNLFVDWNAQSNLNVLKVEEVILQPTPYGGKTVAVLGLRRIVPGLLPSKVGYYTAGSNRVIVLNDMVEFQAEEKILEVEQNRFFSKYEDKRFVKFWHSIGLDLNVEKASKIYNKLMKKDFLGRPRSFVARAVAMETAIHEAKHLVDQIEHPELTLNLDAEFSAHVTSAIFNPAPNVALLSAIRRMENYAMYHRLSSLNEVTRKLWEFAIRSANDQTYSDDSLRQDLVRLYCGYRTVREHVPFGPLGNFNSQIAVNVAGHYKLADSLSQTVLECVDLPVTLPKNASKEEFTTPQVRYLPVGEIEVKSTDSTPVRQFDKAYYGGVGSTPMEIRSRIVIEESGTGKVVYQE